MSSLASSGEVSLVFHVRSEDADMALSYAKLRGRPLELTLSLP